MSVKAVRERLSTLQQTLVTEADVLDRAFAVSVGTRELYDTIMDASRTVELYTSLGSTNIRVAAWSEPQPITGVQFFETDKPEIALPTDTFEMRSRPLQRYRADASNGGSYLVSSMEYLVLNTPKKTSPTAQPRMFVLFRISQTPTQQYGDIMQLHEYITFYRAGRDAKAHGVKAIDRTALEAADRASYARTIVNYRPSIEYEGSKPVLHHLIKRIAIPSMRKSFADWVKALGPLAARFRKHLMDLALKAHAEKEAAIMEQAKKVLEPDARSDDDSDEDSDEGEDGHAAGSASAGGRSPGKGRGKGGKGGSKSAASGAGAGSASGAGDSDADASAGTGSATSIKATMAAAKAASKLKFRAQSMRKKRAKRLTPEERDARRFGKLTDKLRSDTEGFTSEIRRMVFDNVSSRGVDTPGRPRRVHAATDDEAESGGEGDEEEDPSAAGAGGDGFDGAEWGKSFASKGDEFGVLDGFEFRRKAAGRDRCHLVLEQVGDEDLAARFWAQTFSRDCSIWPGAFAGDDSAKSALDSLMVPMADPADVEEEPAQPDKAHHAAEAETEADAAIGDGSPLVPSAAGSVGGQAVTVQETTAEPRGFGESPATARPSLFDYMRSGLTLGATGAAPPSTKRASPAQSAAAGDSADATLAAEDHAELLAQVLQSLRLGAGSALPSDVKAMVFGGPQRGRAAAEAARNRRAALVALDESPARPPAAAITTDAAADAGPASTATAESKESADEQLTEDGKAAPAPASTTNGAATGDETPTELSKILQAVDVLPPSAAQPDRAAGRHPDRPQGRRLPKASSSVPASERLSAWLHDRQGALDDAPPPSERAAFVAKPSSPEAEPDGYASADSGGYLTEVERGGDFKPLGGGAGGAFDPSKAMTPLEALAAREQSAADTAPARDSPASGSGNRRGDCTPADLPCSVM